MFDLWPYFLAAAVVYAIIFEIVPLLKSLGRRLSGAEDDAKKRNQ